jgi:rhodanese-related sulfurtransferase
VVIDVRSPLEFKAEHIPGAKNIPLDKIQQHVTELKSAKHAVVLYCRSGNRSAQALSILKEYGVENAYNGGSIDQMRTYLN